MIKVLLLLPLIFSTSVYAVDRSLSCTGANCKVKIVTKNGSNASVTAAEVSTSGFNLKGRTSGSTPPAGYVGEHINSVGVTNPSISVTAGNWLVWCNCKILWGNGNQPSEPSCGVSTISNNTFEDYKYITLLGTGQSPAVFL